MGSITLTKNSLVIMVMYQYNDIAFSKGNVRKIVDKF